MTNPPTPKSIEVIVTRTSTGVLMQPTDGERESGREYAVLHRQPDGTWRETDALSTQEVGDER